MDRLSGLSDDVIGDILSFLPTIKSLVETSTLSKAWRFRWAHSTRTAYYIETPTHHDSNIATAAAAQFNDDFHRGSGATDSEFESWIFARRNNFQKLVIHLHHHLKLPPCLFASQTLVDLCLVNCGCIATSVAIDFPALRKLQLTKVVFENQGSLTHLLSRCPVLVELIIRRMTFSINDCKRCFPVSSPTLTRLVLDLNLVILVLDTPALEFLRLRLRGSTVKLDQPLRFLIEADIDMNEEMSQWVFTDVAFPTSMLIKFVGKLCNVKRLTLSTRPIEWTSPLTLDVKFHNLIELKLSADWQFIKCFLINADNLRLLTICRTVRPKVQHWNEPKVLPISWCLYQSINETACLNSHLERVIVVDFGWSKYHEFDMISYILMLAKVLKTMEIQYTQCCDLYPKQKLKAHKKLALFERGSKNCQLVFV